MSRLGREAKIHCPIGLFDAQEVKIKALTKAVNTAPNASEKIRHARDLVDELGVLLTCPNYSRSNPNCELCRGFSELRLQTANLIVRVGMGAAAR